MKRTKRICSLILCLLLAAMTVAGCGGAAAPAASGEAPAAPAASAPPGEPGAMQYVMPTGSMGGSYYSSGTVIAEVLSNKIEGLEMSIRAGGTQENAGLLEMGETDIAMASGADYVAVLEAQPMESENIRSMMCFNELYQFVVVAGDSPANSLRDLQGQKIQMGDRRSGQYLMNAALLAAYGLSEEDFACEYMAQGDGTTAFNEGKLDANLVTSSLPSSLLEQLATNPGGFKILPVEAEVLEQLTTLYPYYFALDASPDVFPDTSNITETTPFMMQWGEILVRADMDEELVYRMTKTLCESHEELVEKYGGLVGCTAENTVKYAAFPLHPGTERYFKEIGLL